MNRPHKVLGIQDGIQRLNLEQVLVIHILHIKVWTWTIREQEFSLIVPTSGQPLGCHKTFPQDCKSCKQQSFWVLDLPDNAAGLQYMRYSGILCIVHYKSIIYLKGKGLATPHIAHIHDIGGPMAYVVIEEDLDDVFVSRVQQQQLPGTAALVARLPERVVVPDCVCPARQHLRASP